MKNMLALMAVLGLFSIAGCGGGGDDNGGPPRSDNGIDPWYWRDGFYVVARDGQGYPGSAAYTPGNAVKVLAMYAEIYSSDLTPNWKVGTGFVTEIVPTNRVPASSTVVQLVLATVLSHTTKAYYTNAGSFEHYSCHAELREALTGRLIASKDFKGDDKAPAKIHGPLGHGADDLETMAPAISAWLAAFY